MAEETYHLVDVVEVPRADLMAHAGRNWSALVDIAETDPVLLLRRVRYGDVRARQEDHPKWTPVLDKDLKPLPFLPLEKAWLREVDGRAFLYLQNW